MFSSSYRSLSVLKVSGNSKINDLYGRMALLDSGAEINVIRDINNLTEVVPLSKAGSAVELISASGDNIKLDGKGKLNGFRSDVYAASSLADNFILST